MSETLISGGLVVTDGKKEEADILIKEGRIERIAPSISAPQNAEIIQAEGKWILPV